MKAEPLNNSIYNKAKEQGIEQIILRFSGGNDEGYLYIEIIPYEKDKGGIAGEIEDWAWAVYDYSGAGEGNDYGDDITYDLKEGKVTTSEWFTSRQEGDSDNDKLEINDEE